MLRTGTIKINFARVLAALLDERQSDACRRMPSDDGVRCRIDMRVRLNCPLEHTEC